MKQNKMAAVRELLSSNPDVTPTEIVAILAKQKILISEGVASNYKSVIRSGAKGRKRGKRKLATPNTVTAAVSAGSSNHGLDPAVVDLLKAGQSLGWDKVKSIAELMG